MLLKPIGLMRAVTGGGEPELLLGLSATPPNSTVESSNTLYYMGQTAQASGTVAKGYVYQLEVGGANVHICIFSSTGTLLGVSPAITINAEGAWASVDWPSGPTLTQGTTYIIGFLGNGYWPMPLDTSSPTWPSGYKATMTYGSEDDFSPDPFTQSYGDLGCYVTT